MIIQSVFTYEDGSRVLYDTEAECYLVRSSETLEKLAEVMV